MTAYVVAPASGEVDPAIRPGQVQFEVYETATMADPVAVQTLSQGQAADVAGLDVTFVREHQYTGLIVARDPGAPFIWLGCFLLIAGTAVVFFFPSRRVWALVRPDRAGTSTVQVAAIVRHDVGFGAEFERMGEEIRVTIKSPPADEGKGTV